MPPAPVWHSRNDSRFFRMPGATNPRGWSKSWDYGSKMTELRGNSSDEEKDEAQDGLEEKEMVDAVQTFGLGTDIDDDLNTPVDAGSMLSKAESASGFLKALSHEGRLMILCHLSTGEKTVTELERLLSSRQAAVSQQLARLRLEGLVSHRREGKAIYYSLADDRARRMIELVYDMFCSPQQR